MAPNPPADISPTALQRRIVTHMNADHADSLALFLHFHNQLPPALARDPQLEAITLDGLTIRSSYGRSHVALVPPLASYADARARMVSMHAEARAGLGVSDVRVDAYVPPRGVWQVTIFGLCLVCLVSFSPVGKADLGPEAARAQVNLLFLFWSVGGLVPALSYFAHDMATYVLLFIVVVHSAETAWLAYSRLRRHRVDIGTLVWWQWVLSCFIEGYGSFVRFDRLVREKEEEKAKKQH